MHSTKTETMTLWVCFNCANLLANGEYPDDFTMGVDSVPLSAIDFAAGDEITLGMMWSDHIGGCDAENNFRNSVECNCETVNQSSTPCDACNDSHAGERLAATLWFTPEP